MKKILGLIGLLFILNSCKDTNIINVTQPLSTHKGCSVNVGSVYKSKFEKYTSNSGLYTVRATVYTCGYSLLEDSTYLETLTTDCNFVTKKYSLYTFFQDGNKMYIDFLVKSKTPFKVNFVSKFTKENGDTLTIESGCR